ncbi:MAG: hypothetical protein HQL32_13975 [Planctomycetes bacterium]|nr:hypothetical protein [Planctomycetota bacterium]
MSSELQPPTSILSTFKKIGDLLKGQANAASRFDAKDAYGAGVDPSEFESRILLFYKNAFASMGVGEIEDNPDWEMAISFSGNGLVDTEKLFSLLRLLPDGDVRKIRLLNRFAGQQCYNITVTELFDYETRRDETLKNPFFDTFCAQVHEFAKLSGQDMDLMRWPKKVQESDERKAWIERLDVWREKFIELPGINECLTAFTAKRKDFFNAFFHVQRQFDSEDWKDFDAESNPYPHPLPRIAGYRAALKDLDDEFSETEGSIAMCFDYCRMGAKRVVDFIRGAEDSFLNIVTKLDDDYPKSLDYSHTLLHSKATEVKLMMFPLRCMFFDELEAQRGVRESTDNTLDSYMDMTLGKGEVHIPEQYNHSFCLKDLDEEIAKVFKRLLPPGFSDDQPLNTIDIISKAHSLSQKEWQDYGDELDGICDITEKKYKSDENNITRRLSRLTYLYMRAFAKMDVMGKASTDRLDSIGEIASFYAGHAEKFSKVDIENEGSFKDISEDSLPMMASPEQLEDLFRTQKVVQRLSDNDDDFDEQAQTISDGLKAAIDMMKKAEEFMNKMVNKMFPDKEDSKDLLQAIHDLIELSYKTQVSLADASKLEASAIKLDDKKKKEIEKLKQQVEKYKSDTLKLQSHLKSVLESKNELVQKMRITKDEKVQYQKQLKMITIMTINSMQAQGKSSGN